MKKIKINGIRPVIINGMKYYPNDTVEVDNFDNLGSIRYSIIEEKKKKKIIKEEEDFKQDKGGIYNK